MNQYAAAKLLARRLGRFKQVPETSPLRDMYADWEQGIQATLMAHWDGQSMAVVDALGAGDLVSVERNGAELLDNASWWNSWTAAYTALLIPFMESATSVGANAATDALLVDYALGLDASAVNASVADWARRYAGSLAKDLTGTDLENLRQQLASWTESHEDFQSLVERVQRVIGDRTRAELISSTEATDAYAAGNRLAWKESGVVTGEIWNTAQDELVCKAICRPLSGQVSRLGAGDWHSVDGGADFGPHRGPSGHPRCRCWTSPYTEPLPWESE